MELNYRQVYSNKWVQLVFAILMISLTLSSAVSADTYESNYYSSYEGPNEGFFSGMYDGIKEVLSSIPEIALKYFLKTIFAFTNFGMDVIVMLLEEPAPIGSFYKLWKIIALMSGTIITLVLLIHAFNLSTAGDNDAKSANAKNAIKNTLLLAALVPSSYFIYSLLLEISTSLTSGMLSFVNSSFLYLGEGSLPNLSMEVGLGIPYSITALLTLILLTIRFVLVAGGVVVFPIGLILYFIPLTQGYGKLILNFLFVNMFSSFFIAMLLAIFSLMTNSGILSGLESLYALSCLMTINLFLLYVMFFSAIKAVMGTGKQVMAIAKYFA